MKWYAIAGIAGAVVVAVPILIAGVGLALPRDHNASRSIVLHRPPDAIFRTIRDVASGPQWRRGLERVEMLDGADGRIGGRTRFREHSGHNVVTFEVMVDAPPHRFVTRIADRNLPFGGSWTFDIDPIDAHSTRIAITERGEIYNPIFRTLARFVFGYTKSIDAYLVALGRRFGEEVQPSDP
ncbi:MAG TPA: SRPBCC family protein [Thermoanaerobaculia bacterium]|nr:SRPBCC family protein [Thermoanaerobaculia bacterium]